MTDFANIVRGVRATKDLNNITYWFPKIQAAGLPVPRTEILEMPDDAFHDAWRLFDGKKPEGPLDAFVEVAKASAEKIGYPLFLRSGHTSGKHEWSRTCFVPSADELGKHIFAIAYFSECAGMFGELPWQTWAFRELLPTEPIGICSAFDDMPICKEFRFFVEDGKVLCWHPYWPRHALDQGGAKIEDDTYADLCRMDDLPALTELAEAAGRAVGGAWSVDLLATKRGWFVTDMAVAADSWHWEDCTRAQTKE